MSNKPTKSTRSAPENKKSTSLNNKSGMTEESKQMSLAIPSQASRGSSAQGVDISNKLKGMMNKNEEKREEEAAAIRKKTKKGLMGMPGVGLPGGP